MKTVKFVAFLFYRYYSGGRRPDSMPYFRTICSMTLLAFIHVFQAMIIIEKTGLVEGWITSIKNDKEWVIAAIMILLYFFLAGLIKKEELEELKTRYSYDWDKVFKGNVWLVVYIILSFSGIFVLVVIGK